MNTKQRNKEIIKLRGKGLSYGSIKDFINEKYNLTLSRQRIHQISSGYRSPSNDYVRRAMVEAIKERDKHTCQFGELCKGQIVDDNELVVHHLDFNDKNNDPSNLITLCRKCHSSFHSRFHIDSRIQHNIDFCKGVKRKERVITKCLTCGGKRETIKGKETELTKVFCSPKCKVINIGFQYYMMAKEGKSLTEIAIAMNSHQPNVSRIKKRAKDYYNLPSLGLVERNLAILRGKKGTLYKRSVERKVLAKKLYAEKNRVEEIAEELGVSENYIYKLIKD